MPAIAVNIQEKSEALAEICRRFQVARLELFGSACTPEFDGRRSDIDFLVEFLPGADLGPWLSRLFELRTALGGLFGRAVDLIMASALRDPWFRREAGKTRTLVYDASQEPQVVS
jgi:predicted nucleotidyltransferase